MIATHENTAGLCKALQMALQRRTPIVLRLGSVDGGDPHLVVAHVHAVADDEVSISLKGSERHTIALDSILEAEVV